MTTSSNNFKHYQLSSSQRKIWFEQILHPDVPLHNIGGYLRIEGAINIAFFEQSLYQIINENDALRLILCVCKENNPIQMIAENVRFKLDYHNLSEQENAQSHALDWMEKEFAKPFPLYDGFLFQFALLKISKDCYYWFGKFHNIIVDEWAISLILQRVATKYKALVDGQDCVEPANYSYIDLLKNDQAYLVSKKYTEHKNYWLAKYQDLDLSKQLIPRRYAGKFQGKTIPSKCTTLHLEESLYKQLINLAKENQVSIHLMILGALYYYFSRIEDRDEIVIGLSALNRHNPAFKQTVGQFAGISSARFGFGTDLSFNDIVQAISKDLRRDYKNQRFPLNEINQQLGLFDYQQLFDILLSYEKNETNLLFNGNPAYVNKFNNGFNQNGLSIVLREQYHDKQNIKLDIDFNYNLSSFNEDEIKRLKGRFEFLLGEIIRQPQLPIRELQIMPETEFQQILVEFNNTMADYPLDKTIVDLFEEQVEKTPDKIAIVFEDQQLTYQELNTQANKLAHYLQSIGVRAEVLIGLCLERSLEMMIGLLAIFKAGAAYLALDPESPAARNAFLLDEAQVPVLITRQKFIKGWSINEAQVICLDSFNATFSQFKTDNPLREILPANLAYVIYGSSSTGQPKGVIIQHQCLMNHNQAIIKQYQVHANDKCLQFARLNSDVAVEEIFPTLLSGATLVLRPSKMTFADFTQFIRSENLSVLNLPAAFWQEWVMDLSQTKDALPDSLRLVVVDHDKIMLDRFHLWQQLEHNNKVKLLYAYGYPEATITTTIYDPANSLNEELELASTVPIGRPIANTEIYILDRHLQLTPIGVPGEIYIGGAGLTIGYLNNPDLKAEKFIHHPFCQEMKSENSFLYKTGDLARYLPDGNIEHLDRFDNQFKIHNFRIEPEEIEIALLQHPDVRDSVILTKQDKFGQSSIVAYIVSNFLPRRIPYRSTCIAEIEGQVITLNTEDISSGGVGLEQVDVTLNEGQDVRLCLQLPGNDEACWLNGTVTWSRSPIAGIKFHLTSNEQIVLLKSVEYLLKKQGILKALQRIVAGNLRNYLKEMLPNYMIPASFILINALPRKSNGEVDRCILLKSTSIRQNKEKEFVKPLSQTEKLIAATWADILGQEKIGIHDNFFELGGHSLHVMQFISRIAVAMNVEKLVKKLLSNPTIAELAKELDGLV